MEFFFILPIALALAMDAFAVSVGLSVSQKGLSNTQAFRTAASFGFFQFLMPVLGWLAGQMFMEAISAVDHWIAFGLLAFIGFKMIYESFQSGTSASLRNGDRTKGFVLFVLSVATSIDALAVGLSFSALDLPILFPAAFIGGVAFAMTVVGTKLGPLFGRLIGKRAEFFGGCVLLVIGIKILVEHL